MKELFGALIAVLVVAIIVLIKSAIADDVNVCHTIVYSLYGEMTEIECVDDLRSYPSNTYVRFYKDDVCVLIRPDAILIKEHTHD